VAALDVCGARALEGMMRVQSGGRELGFDLK
jgi:hypothetical protein